MPRRLAHDLVGAVAGFAAWFATLLFQGDLDRTIEALHGSGTFLAGVVQMIMFLGLAVIGSRLPDRIERPVSRQHRGIFHNLPLFILLTLLTLYWVSSDASSVSSFVLAFIFGYDSHLFLDVAL